MLISELSQETVEELCSALEKGLTLGWKVLMKKWFRTLYSEDDVAIIESNKDPAKVLLDDLTLREITLQELVNGLEKIGNKKAVSIIMKGNGCFFFFFFIFVFRVVCYTDWDISNISEIRQKMPA